MCSVFFNYESGKFRRELDGGLAVELLTEAVPYRNPRDTAMFELHMYVAEKDGALACECDYNRDLYDPATVLRWLGHYRTLLEGIVNEPDLPVASLPLLDARERETILHGWNATDAPGHAGDTLPDLFRAADLFVLPAVHDGQGNVDGLPNVILEAMASALPVVASAISGIPLAVEDGHTGRLIPEQDPAALLSALRELLANREAARSMGERGRRKAAAELTWDAVAARYRDGYRMALGCAQRQA